MKAIAIPFATLCLAATTHFADDVVLPETPAGAALAGWLEVAREGDAGAVAEHWAARMSSDFKEAVPLDQYAGFMTQVSAMLRDADVGRVNEESEHELVAYARFAGTWLQISLSVRATEPHEISGLHVRPGDPPATGPDPLRAGWQDLPELLERVRATHGFPALAAARMRAGKIVERAAVGVRAHGSEDEALPGDLFHFGSVTKSITATMIGRLIEAGTLDWTTTVAEALPELEMGAAYRGVTLEQLLWHRGGVPQAMTFDDADMSRLVGLPGTPTEQRASFLREVLAQEPIAAPGAEMHYSNAGYALAGLMAERAAKKPWSELVRAHVLAPLRLESMGFGWPATAERPAQPRGHYRDGDSLRVQGLDEYDLGAFLAPAGDVHGSIDDLLRYAAAHLAGLRGKDGVLRAATVQRLHTPPPGGDYAAGWVVAEEPGGGRVHWHNGSAGTFYALVQLFPDRDEAVAVLVNEATAESAALAISTALRERAREDEAARSE